MARFWSRYPVGYMPGSNQVFEPGKPAKSIGGKLVKVVLFAPLVAFAWLAGQAAAPDLKQQKDLSPDQIHFDRVELKNDPTKTRLGATDSHGEPLAPEREAAGKRVGMADGGGPEHTIGSHVVAAADPAPIARYSGPLGRSWQTVPSPGRNDGVSQTLGR